MVVEYSMVRVFFKLGSEDSALVIVGGFVNTAINSTLLIIWMNPQPSKDWVLKDHVLCNLYANK